MIVKQIKSIILIARCMVLVLGNDPDIWKLSVDIKAAKCIDTRVKLVTSSAAF